MIQYRTILSFGIGVVVILLIQNVNIPNRINIQSQVVNTHQEAYEEVENTKASEEKYTFIGLPETIEFNIHHDIINTASCEGDLFSFNDVNLEAEMNRYKECEIENYDRKWPYDKSLYTFFKENGRVYKHSDQWTYLRNVCFDTSSSRLYLYQDSGSYPELDFPLSILSELKEGEYVFPSQNSWILFPSPEIEVFFQQLALLHSVVLHPDQFPPLDHLYLPTLQQSMDATFFLLKGLEKEFQFYRTSPVVFHTSSDIPSVRYICFNGLTVAGQQRHPFVGSLFPSLLDSYLFRSHYYKLFTTKSSFSIDVRKPVLSLLVLTRLHPQDEERVINQDAIDYARNNLRSYFTIKQKDVSNQVFSEVVKIVLTADILLAATNPALVLSVFLAPRSGVVEILPVNYRSGYYHNLAVSSDLYYLAHTNFTEQFAHSQECSYSVQDVEIWEKEAVCKKEFLQKEVYVPPITLWMILTDISRSVHHNKYHIFNFTVC